MTKNQFVGRRSVASLLVIKDFHVLCWVFRLSLYGYHLMGSIQLPLDALNNHRQTIPNKTFLACMFYFANSDKVMFLRQFAFCLVIN